MKVKKSIDIPKDLNEKIERIIEANDEVTFTFVVIQALKAWVKKPEFQFEIPKQSSRKGK